ncbi:hypothetical protein LCGC14_3158670 [marine sediment metagenome]|uniref:Uncharacterized protein n=1 Tax=marine sediment metagenome TaxID=412755 RepID=A0A0F8YGE3_9ZZZZ
MTIQTRREFLGGLGWMAVGSLIIPYIPKTFYSIPKPTAWSNSEGGFYVPTEFADELIKQVWEGGVFIGKTIRIKMPTDRTYSSFLSNPEKYLNQMRRI